MQIAACRKSGVAGRRRVSDPGDKSVAMSCRHSAKHRDRERMDRNDARMRPLRVYSRGNYCRGIDGSHRWISAGRAAGGAGARGGMGTVPARPSAQAQARGGSKTALPSRSTASSDGGGIPLSALSWRGARFRATPDCASSPHDLCLAERRTKEQELTVPLDPRRPRVRGLRICA